MKIQNLSLISYKNNFKAIQNKKEKNNLSFSLQTYPKIHNNEFLAFKGIKINQTVTPYDFESFCNKAGKVTKEEYREIKKAHPEIIEKAKEFALKYNGKLTPHKIASFAYAMKKNLDEKYQNNYRIISIGTSPYQFTQTMEYLGAKVAYIPISSLHHFDEKNENINNCENLKIALRYLKEQLDNLANDENTENLIIDYTFTGLTLQNIRNLIVANNITAGQSTKGVSLGGLFIDLNDKSIEILEKIYQGYEDYSSVYNLYFEAKEDMNSSEIAQLSNIPHNQYNLNCKKTYPKKAKEFKEFSKPMARCFNLCILDELDKINEVLQKKETTDKLPKITDNSIFLGERKNHNFRPFVEEGSKRKKEHKKRKEKYGSELTIPARYVSNKEYKAMELIQFEKDPYSTVQKKLRAKEPLNAKENKFYNYITSAMTPSEEEKILWRVVDVYDGFVDSINKGSIDLDGFISTSACYNDFFEFWGGPSSKTKDENTYIPDTYFLRIIAPKGTPILDCNARHGRLGTRLREEIILAPAKCSVKDIDIEHKVITLLYENINENELT